VSQELQVTTPPVIHPNVQPNFGGPSIRQLKFIDRYLETGNATESARYAGYNGDDATLAQIGSRLLKSVKIRTEIQRKLGTSVASGSEVLERLTQHARGDLTDVLKPDGTFDLRYARRRGSSKLLKKLKVKRTIDKDGSEHIDHEYEIHDPQAALEKLGRFHKLFTDRVETEVANPQAIAQQTISLLREAMLAARQAQVGQLSAGESGPGGPVVETTAIIGDTHE
jgi:phage terminase small subunit